MKLLGKNEPSPLGEQANLLAIGMHKRLLSLLGAAYSKVHLFGHLEMTSLEDAFQRARRMLF